MLAQQGCKLANAVGTSGKDNEGVQVWLRADGPHAHDSSYGESSTCVRLAMLSGMLGQARDSSIQSTGHSISSAFSTGLQ